MERIPTPGSRKQYHGFRGFSGEQFPSSHWFSPIHFVLCVPVWLGVEEFYCRGQQREGIENSELDARVYDLCSSHCYRGDFCRWTCWEIGRVFVFSPLFPDDEVTR